MRRRQLSFDHGLIAGEVSDVREDWMHHADRVLADEQIVAAVYERWRGGIPRAVAAAGAASLPRRCCGS